MSDNDCEVIPNPVCRVELSRMSKTLDEIHEGLLGKAGSSQPGLVVRVDRQEQTEKARSMWMKVLGGAVIASLVSTVAELLKK